MLNGICPKCASRWYGWVLQRAEARVCPRCSSQLEVVDDGGQVIFVSNWPSAGETGSTYRLCRTRQSKHQVRNPAVACKSDTLLNN